MLNSRLLKYVNITEWQFFFSIHISTFFRTREIETPAPPAHHFNQTSSEGIKEDILTK